MAQTTLTENQSFLNNMFSNLPQITDPTFEQASIAATFFNSILKIHTEQQESGNYKIYAFAPQNNQCEECLEEIKGIGIHVGDEEYGPGVPSGISYHWACFTRFAHTYFNQET